MRPGRRLRESERSGGAGGRLDLRREMLRVELREYEEEVLVLLLSELREGEEVSLSELTERPEESPGSQLQPETRLISGAAPVQSDPLSTLRTLPLGDRV